VRYAARIGLTKRNGCCLDSMGVWTLVVFSGFSAASFAAAARPGVVDGSCCGWGMVPLAVLSLLIGALCSRYGCVLAGRASALDPQEILASQGRG
jgi:hypothetical protein